MYMYVSARYSVVRLQYTTEETVNIVGVVVRRYVRNNVIIPIDGEVGADFEWQTCVCAVIAAAVLYFVFG